MKFDEKCQGCSESRKHAKSGSKLLLRWLLMQAVFVLLTVFVFIGHMFMGETWQQCAVWCVIAAGSMFSIFHISKRKQSFGRTYYAFVEDDTGHVHTAYPEQCHTPILRISIGGYLASVVVGQVRTRLVSSWGWSILKFKKDRLVMLDKESVQSFMFRQHVMLEDQSGTPIAWFDLEGAFKMMVSHRSVDRYRATLREKAVKLEDENRELNQRLDQLGRRVYALEAGRTGRVTRLVAGLILDSLTSVPGELHDEWKSNAKPTFARLRGIVDAGGYVPKRQSERGRRPNYAGVGDPFLLPQLG
ncbi:hypothetical protein KKG41_01010 [Patescibacteria group bacterium]|nr:hypothetical protein [Patescibacteria group bacterium]MBU1890283.1 hypothetical protein [Patescibacteria group bacterium]